MSYRLNPNIILKEKNFVFDNFAFSEYSLANLYLFRETYKYCKSNYWDNCLEGYTRYNKKFIIPLSNHADIFQKHGLDMLKKGFELYPLHYMEAVSLKNKLHVLNLDISYNRDQSDYIYNIDHFLSAKGKHFKKMRQYQNKLIREFNIQPTPITEKNSIDVIKFLIINKQQANGSRTDFQECYNAIRLIETGILKGICIYVNDNIEAFIIYDDLSLNKTTIALLMKTNHKFRGLSDYCYRYVCKETSYNQYLNTCQDLGITGLRIKKQKMIPAQILHKYSLFIKS